MAENRFTHKIGLLKQGNFLPFTESLEGDNDNKDKKENSMIYNDLKIYIYNEINDLKTVAIIIIIMLTMM